jgi:hypothetical protein
MKLQLFTALALVLPFMSFVSTLVPAATTPSESDKNADLGRQSWRRTQTGSVAGLAHSRRIASSARCVFYLTVFTLYFRFFRFMFSLEAKI